MYKDTFADKLTPRIPILAPVLCYDIILTQKSKMAAILGSKNDIFRIGCYSLAYMYMHIIIHVLAVF